MISLEKLENQIQSVLVKSKYNHLGHPVPRVTEILSQMLHDDYLMDWANVMGRRGLNHNTFKDEAADIGSYTHMSIERYLSTGNIDFSDVPEKLLKRVNHSFNSFLMWWNIVNANNIVKIIGQEESLTCEYCGGTYDLLLEINGKIYLVDFKTSNHIGYKYFIQLAVYRYLIKENKNLEIDGFIILQLSKKDDIFYEYILTMDNQEHANYMQYAFECFKGLIYGYYHRLYLEETFNTLF